jgi:hypothetical protein
MERKPEPPKTARLPKDEAHPPHDDPSHQESPPQASERSRNREFRQQARRRLEKDWLATAGSERERQFLTRWSKQEGLSEKDRKLIYAWLDTPDGFEKRNALFWNAAKKSVLGAPVYDAAIERHSRLNGKEWLVAYFTVEGVRQKEIAEWTKLSEREVDNVIRSIKDKISLDFGCEIERVDLAQIARWFFGL